MPTAKMGLLAALTLSLSLPACGGHERPVSVADLQGQVVLRQAVGGVHGVYFSLDPPEGSFDTNRCPILHDDVHATVNGTPVSLYSRGGFYRYARSGPIGAIVGDLADACHEIAGDFDFHDAAPAVVEVVFSDGSGTISSQAEALFDEPAIALAPGQPPLVSPGDSVRLGLTPATSHLDHATGASGPLRIGTAAEIAELDSAGSSVRSLQFTDDGGEIRFTVPKLAAGAVQVVLDRPALQARTPSCIGAASCVSENDWAALITAPVTLTILDR